MSSQSLCAARADSGWREVAPGCRANASFYRQALKSPKKGLKPRWLSCPCSAWTCHLVTLRVTQRFCDVSDVCLRLKAPFHPSASYFDGAKVTKPLGSVSGPTSSGSF
ncbi:hypothetical protein ALO81_101339, partial [Pseudomonas cannabina]